MNDVTLAITILWGFILFYAVIASIDFGAGFWSMVYLNRKKSAETTLANRYLSPTWEVTNVFIVLIVVGMFSFFPGATQLLGCLILYPATLMVLLLTIRSAFLVFSHTAHRFKTALIWVSGITGLLIPIFLILILPITQGLFLSGKGMNSVSLDIGRFFTTPSFYVFAVYAMVNTCFLSSLLLMDYAQLVKDRSAFHSFFNNVLWLGPVTMGLELGILIAANHDSKWLAVGLSANRWALILSAILFIVSYVIVLTKRPRIAMIGIVIHYMFAGFAYGKAHLPYLIYPYITLKQGFTDPATFHALALSYIIGALVLVPGFIFFWKLFLSAGEVTKQSSHVE